MITSKEKLEKLKRLKKTGKIICVTSGLFCIIALIVMFVFLITKEEIIEAIIRFLLCTIAICILYFLQYYFFKEINFEIEITEKQEKTRLNIIEQNYLKTDDYIEIDYIDESVEESIELLYFKSKSKFYARLISEYEIEVIEKDQEGKLVNEPKRITNFSYFEYHYKPKLHS